MVGAEVEHGSRRTREPDQRAGAMSSRSRGSAVEELPGGLLRAGYHHRAALCLSLMCRSAGVGRRALIGFAKAFAPRKDDLGVFDQAVGDGRRDGGVVEDIPPVGKGCVGRDSVLLLWL